MVIQLQRVQLIVVLYSISTCQSFTPNVPSSLTSSCNFRETFLTRMGFNMDNSKKTRFNVLSAQPSNSQSHQNQTPSVESVARRNCLISSLLSVSALTTSSDAALSAPLLASSKLADEDKSKIYKGYVQLNYLLDHWEEETTVCGRTDNPYISKNGCERTPVKVMDYLGYKDVSHPLFKADKTIRRLEPFVPNGREDDFYDAIESWMIAAEEGNGMAYISSWGEANPGGGKDRVQLFIERAKNNVIKARDSLATVVDIFDIQKD